MLTDEKYYISDDEAYEIASSGRPGYDVMFIPNRVPVGSAIDSEEFARRICYALQIPLRHGARITKAVASVINEAAANGEGVQFHKFGVFKFKKYNNNEHRLPDGTIVDRKSIYKLKFYPHSGLTNSLVKLTKKQKDTNGL